MLNLFCKTMKNKNAILLILVLFLGMLIGGVLVKYTTPHCDDSISNNNEISNSDDNEIPNPTVSTSVENNKSNEPENANAVIDITYTTFSSPKADFTFEYPDTWVYDERENNGIISWGFYSKSIDNHNSVPYLEIQSPIMDAGAVGFSTGAPDLEKGEPLRPYHNAIYVFATNDPSTFVTYQWGGRGKLENGSGYVYWEKGQYFINSSSLSGHNKYNFMRVNPIPEKGQEIGLHIAQSIKIK